MNLSLDEIFVTLDKIKGEEVQIIGKDFLPLVKGGGYNLLTGRGGVGKSMVSIRAMVRFLKLNKKQKGLGYFTEDDKEEVHSRLRSVCFNEHNMSNDEYLEIFKRCIFVTVENDPMWKFVRRGQNDYELTPEYFAFQEFLLNRNVGFLILDPLKAYHTLNENDNTDMDFVVRNAMKPLSTKTGCCLLILHHSAKDKNGSRGASTISDSGRVSYSLDRVHKKTPDGKLIPDERFNGMVRLTVEKDNKNIFSYCNILDENSMFKVFPTKQQKQEHYSFPVEVEMPYV